MFKEPRFFVVCLPYLAKTAKKARLSCLAGMDKFYNAKIY